MTAGQNTGGIVEGWFVKCGTRTLISRLLWLWRNEWVTSVGCGTVGVSIPSSKIVLVLTMLDEERRQKIHKNEWIIIKNKHPEHKGVKDKHPEWL